MSRNDALSQADLKRHLFYETSHSPSLVDLLGYERAREIIDFCFIANPYYPTEAMLKDLQQKLPMLIKSYPSSNPELSQNCLADVLHVNPQHLLIGNGATELITLINETLVPHLGVPVPTFGEYIEKLKDKRDAELYFLKADRDYQLDLTAYLAWIRRRRLKSFLIINPGNPTGQRHSLDEMRALLEASKDMELVIVDESFIDFAGDEIPSLLPYADHYSNLLIVRSMSKHCGVPGLRLGYCYSGNLYLLNRLRHFIPTWNINTLAEFFISLLPATDADYHRARRHLIADVHALVEDLQKVPHIKVYPTGANFVLFRVENGLTATALQKKLLDEHQLYVRDCSNKLGMDNFHIRVASQGREKDVQLISALQKVMSEPSTA